MKNIIRAVIATAVLAAGMLAFPSPSDAAASGCASWGCATNVQYLNGRWYGTVDDTKTDGWCVDLWTVNSSGAKIGRIARSCGAPKTGSAWGGGAEDAYGVRMFRDNGNYKTIVFP